MAYDLAWFLLLDVLVAGAGASLLRHPDARPPSDRDGRTGIGIVALLLASAGLANLPALDGSPLVIFRPDVGPARALNAMVVAGGAVIALDPQGGYAVVKLPRGGASATRSRAGAVLVTRSPAVAGCLAFASG